MQYLQKVTREERLATELVVTRMVKPDCRVSQHAATDHQVSRDEPTGRRMSRDEPASELRDLPAADCQTLQKYKFTDLQMVYRLN